MSGFPRQEDLIRRCAALNPNTVVAITAGASVEVVNTGSRKGRAVVQCYVSKPAQPGVEMPVKELADFASVELGPGEAGRVEFAFDDKTFAFWSEKDGAWRPAEGEARVRVGFSSVELPLQATLSVTR